jgi:cyclopropane-fatty-acyl-phospholipid synthase
MHVLDIGCGWGSFAIFAAERYGVRVTGITVSREQVELARLRAGRLPIEIRLQDYRDLNDTYDAIVSIGMFEHVGDRNYRTFFRVARRCLADDGLLLLHTIGSEISGAIDPWIEKYIFPGGVIPSSDQIRTAAIGLFHIEDWHKVGRDYDPTLMSWCRNFELGWDGLKDRYGERFRRMWRYYLLSCAGAFRAGHNDVFQIVFSTGVSRSAYAPVR